MSLKDENKVIVGRWFTDFWGETCNLAVVDELAAPDMLLQYSLHDAIFPSAFRPPPKLAFPGPRFAAVFRRSLAPNLACSFAVAVPT